MESNSKILKCHKTLNHTCEIKYRNEEVFSNCSYPDAYNGPNDIEEQILCVGDLFKLNTINAMELSGKLPRLTLGAKGWFAIPKISAVAHKHFSRITNIEEQYCKAVAMVFELIKESRPFYNYREGEIVSSQLRQCHRTLFFLQQIELKQPGDIIIIGAQYGMRHRGKSVRRARESFFDKEFGLGAFQVGVMALTHPERFTCWDDLSADCAGDEFRSNNEELFVKAPIFYFDINTFMFDACSISDSNRHFGTVSAFIE